MYLTPHFTTDEVQWGRIPLHYRSNALATLALAERYREVWGNNPVIVHSLWRSPEENAAAGGSATSQHLDATGIDVSVPDLPYDEAVRRVVRSPLLLQVTGEFIYYASRSHFHLTLATRGEVGQVLQRVSGEYQLVASGQPVPPLVRSIPDTGRVVIAALAIGGLLAFGAQRT